MDADDIAIARSLVEHGWRELDRQALDSDGLGDLYVDAADDFVEGRPNMEKLILAILQGYWEEEGR